MNKSVKSLLPIAITAATALSPLSANAQFFGIFLATTNPVIDGGSESSSHKDEIDILSWGWGLSNTASVIPGGTQTGTVSGQTVSVVKFRDEASGPLYQAIIAQTKFDTATLEQVRTPCGDSGEEKVTTKLEMTGATATSSSMGSSGSEEIPTETMTFIYESICITQYEWNVDCSVKTAFGPSCYNPGSK